MSDSTATEAIRLDPDGNPLMPQWSDAPVPTTQGPQRPSKNPDKPPPAPRKRVAKELQPDATQLDNLTEAKAWLKAHPEEAAMLRSAQATHSGDILIDSGVAKRYYSSTEAAAFFDKTVQWLYWGMRHPPNGGRLFIEPRRDKDGNIELDSDGSPVMVDIPVERLGDPKMGKRRFDIPTIRKFAVSAYHQGNIKEPKLRAVLERLVVAERGGNWNAIPIPRRAEDEADGTVSVSR